LDGVAAVGWSLAEKAFLLLIWLELIAVDKGLGWPLATHMLMLLTAFIDAEVVVQLVSL